MKAFQLVGIRKSGKTTTVEQLIVELKSRGYKVGTIKSIDCPTFEMDPKPTSNTRRHREAGADIVIASGKRETDILYREPLSPDAMLKAIEAYGMDICIVEGGYEMDLPRIVCLHTVEELEERRTEQTFAISGVLADTLDAYAGLPAISAMQDCKALADLILGTIKDVVYPIGMFR